MNPAPVPVRRSGQTGRVPARRLSTRRVVSRRSAGASAVLGLLLVAGCGTGNRAQTYLERTTADSTNDAVGTIAVRNLAVTAPLQGTVWKAGSNAPLTVTLVNQGGDPDTLTSATSPVATSVTITGPTPTLQIPRLAAAPSSYRLVLMGLKQDLPTGTYVQLTMVFQRNGTKTMLVPVQTVPQRVAQPTGTYAPPETDSEGAPLGGDNVPETGQDPVGDNAGTAPEHR